MADSKKNHLTKIKQTEDDFISEHLPPLPPEFRWADGHTKQGVAPEWIEILYLPQKAYWSAVRAHEDSLESWQKKGVIMAFNFLWSQHSFWIQKFATVSIGNSPHDRVSLLRDYQAWADDVRKLLKEALSAPKTYTKWLEELEIYAKDEVLLNKHPDLWKQRLRNLFIQFGKVFKADVYREKFDELTSAGLKLMQMVSLMSELNDQWFATLDARRNQKKAKLLEQDLSKEAIIRILNVEWMTITQASRLLGVNKGTVSRWADEGKIQDNKQKGKKRKVSKISVLLMKDKREHEDTLKDAAEVLQDRASKIPNRY
jgi:excisionase family DNA binding protein